MAWEGFGRGANTGADVLMPACSLAGRCVESGDRGHASLPVAEIRGFPQFLLTSASYKAALRKMGRI